MRRVKLGLVGAGVMGTRHIKAIDTIDALELACIADPAVGIQEICQARGIPQYPHAETMLQAEELDAIIIATPTEHHYSGVMAALAHGLTVLVEKPIAATVAQGEEISRFAQAQNCHVLVGHHRRYYPCMQEAREIVQGRQLGKLIAVSGQWTLRKDISYYSAKWRKERSAGPVLTNLVHEIDLLRFICGDMLAVSAEITHHDQNFEKEDAAAIIIKFANNAVGSFVLSDRTPSPWTWEMALGENTKLPRANQNTLRFMGTKGALEFPNLKLWSHPNKDGNWHDIIQFKEIETPFIDAYKAQCEHLCAVVLGKQLPIIDAKNGTRSLDATLAVFEAASKGERITLNS